MDVTQHDGVALVSPVAGHAAEGRAARIPGIDRRDIAEVEDIGVDRARCGGGWQEGRQAVEGRIGLHELGEVYCSPRAEEHAANREELGELLDAA